MISHQASRRISGIAVYLATVLLLTPSSEAQVARLAPEDYGKVALHARQSLGGAVEAVQLSRTIFEPIGSLRSDDPLAIAARAVVRIDLLVEEAGRKALLVCTGTLISPTYILTNSHCVTVSGRQLLKASAVFDHTRATGEGAQRVDLQTVPVEDDAELDYAILRLAGPPPEGISPLMLYPTRMVERQRLRVVHHPLGSPKMMTQFGCQVAKAQDANQVATVRHVCDTQQGSSGAVLLDPSALVGVAVHHSGGLASNDPESFNVATSIIAIAGRSAIIAQLLKGAASLLRRQKVPNQKTAKPRTPDSSPTVSFDIQADLPAREGPGSSTAGKNDLSDVDRINRLLNAQ